MSSNARAARHWPADARIIMGKDQEALLRLWKEKRGEIVGPDFSGELIVQLGLVTEDLNRRWFERQSGHRIVAIQLHAIHRALPWMVATLDGLVEATGAVFEAKFMLPWAFSEGAAAEKHMASYSTTCWLLKPRWQCCRSSMVAEMGRTGDRGRSDLPNRPDRCRKSVLARREDRRISSTVRLRATQAAD